MLEDVLAKMTGATTILAVAEAWAERAGETCPLSDSRDPHDCPSCAPCSICLAFYLVDGVDVAPVFGIEK